jgi:5'-nucleotidase
MVFVLDIIDEILVQQASVHPNVHVVSNYMDFDENDTLVGFKGHLIHTFNKTENSVRSSDYFQEIKERSNVVLIGDSDADPHMADGVEHVANKLSIGFLNDKVRHMKHIVKDQLVKIDKHTHTHTHKTDGET